MTTPSGTSQINVAAGSYNVPPHIKIKQIVLFSTVDKNTAALYGNFGTTLSEGFDVTKIFAELSFSESIFSIAVTGHIILIDNYALFEEARINGQEKIVFVFERYNVESKTYDEELLLEFYVTSIAETNREANRCQFVLNFASPHLHIDKMTRIGRAYGYTDIVAKGSGSQPSVDTWKSKFEKIQVQYHDGTYEVPMEFPEHFIYHILYNDLRIPKDRLFLYGPHQNHDVESSQFPMKLIVPNMRPIKAIEWILRNVYSKDTYHPWFVYETLISGIRIEPYSVLVTDFFVDQSNLLTTGREKKRIEQKFIYNTDFQPDPGSDEYFEQMHQQILEFTTNQSLDKFSKISNGTYSSLIWWQDCASKTVFPNPSTERTAFSLTYTDADERLESTRRTYQDVPQLTSTYVDSSYSKPYPSYSGNQLVIDNEFFHEPNVEKTNYTYYIAFNTMLHGDVDTTRSYHQPFSFKDISVLGIPDIVGTGAGDGAGGPDPLPGDPPDYSDLKDPEKTMLDALIADPRVTDPRHIAYIMATTKHETGNTFLPVKEAYWLSEDWRRNNLRYYPWYGRGFVQITWEENYVRMSSRIGVPALATIPDTALEWNTAYEILVLGMNEGLFTGKKLSDYISGDRVSYTEARRIVNGTDKASLIAGYAVDYEVLVRELMGEPPTTTPPPAPDPTTPAPDPTTPDPTVPAPPISTVLDPQIIGEVGRSGESIRKNLDFMTHIIKVRGDLTLNPGMLLELSVQRTIDPKLVADGLFSGARARPSGFAIDEDAYISGKYFVIESEHIFNEDGFFTLATVTRESSTVSLG